MTDNTEATAQAVETPAAAPEFKTRAVPSEVPKEPEAPSEQPESKPVEQAAEAPKPEAETPAESKADPDEPDDEAGEAAEERKPLPKGVQRKINKLTRRVGEFAEENRELKERLAQLEQGQVQEKPADAKPVADGKPKLEDFDFDVEAHAEALVEWKLEQKAKAEQAASLEKAFREKEAAFEAEHPDYRDVAYSDELPMPPHVAAVIHTTENPPAIAYYLGNNVEEAAQIAQMTPLAAARAIGRIEAKLAAPAEKPAPVLPKKTTTAPPPPKTVSGAGKPQVSPDDPGLTTAQRIALWRAQKA